MDLKLLKKAVIKSMGLVQYGFCLKITGIVINEPQLEQRSDQMFDQVKEFRKQLDSLNEQLNLKNSNVFDIFEKSNIIFNDYLQKKPDPPLIFYPTSWMITKYYVKEL